MSSQASTKKKMAPHFLIKVSKLPPSNLRPSGGLLPLCIKTSPRDPHPPSQESSLGSCEARFGSSDVWSLEKIRRFDSKRVWFPPKIEWYRIPTDPYGSCDRAMRYSGLGVRSVDPVGDFLDGWLVGWFSKWGWNGWKTKRPLYIVLMIVFVW